MPSDRSDGSSKRDLRGASLGIELAAALVGFTLVGFWIDHTYDTSPWGTVVCAVFGLVGGFYNFIRSSLTILRRPPGAGAPPESNERPRDSTR